jgi:hypothetical protein
LQSFDGKMGRGRTKNKIVTKDDEIQNLLRQMTFEWLGKVK